MENLTRNDGQAAERGDFSGFELAFEVEPPLSQPLSARPPEVGVAVSAEAAQLPSGANPCEAATSVTASDAVNTEQSDTEVAAASSPEDTEQGNQVTQPDESDRATKPDKSDIDIDAASDLDLYLHRIARFPLLSKSAETKLGNRKNAGDAAARRKLIESNLRLAVSIAKGYRNLGLDFFDLIQVANQAVIRSADGFDPQKGRFTTYATPNIHGTIKRALDDHKQTIRMGVHSSTQARAVFKAKNALEEELGRKPTSEEVAKKSGVSADKVEHHEQMRGMVSLDEPVMIGDTEAGTVGERLSDGVDLSDLATRQVDSENFMRELMISLSRLSRVERTVFMLRYLPEEGEEVVTLDAIAKQLGVTPQAVKSAETRALNKLKRGRLNKYNPGNKAPDLRGDDYEYGLPEVVGFDDDPELTS